MSRWRAVGWPIAAAIPLHVALAVGTELSPDEAYYLVAARRGPHLLVDHPPLVPWLLSVTDGLFGSVEVGVRVWPVVLSSLTAVGAVQLAEQRGLDVATQGRVALVLSLSLLATAGGFVMTPDTPLLASLVGLLWLAGGPEPTRALPRLASDVAWAAGSALACLSKVVALPVLAVMTVFGANSSRRRLAGLAAGLATLPWIWPSLRFQWDHAYGSVVPWTAARAALAAAEAASVQVALWSPWIVVGGAIAIWRAPGRLGRLDRALAGALTGLVLASALARAHPPEANWWAAAALVVTLWGADHVGRLGAAHRRGLAAAIVVPTAIAASHAMWPWLPLPLERDPTARLHGWSTPSPPIGAPGIGPYGPAAQACVLRDDCREIDEHFIDIQ